MSYDILDTFKRASDERSFKDWNQGQFVHNEGMKATPSSSVILGADGQARATAEVLKAQQERQNDNTELQVMLASIRRINAQINMYQSKIDVLNEEIEDLRDIQNTINDPDFDPDDLNNADVMARAQRHGISKQDIEDGTASAKIDSKVNGMETTIEGYKRKIEDLEKDKADIERDLDAKQKTPDAGSQEARADRMQTFIDAKATDTEIVRTAEVALEEHSVEIGSSIDDDWMSFASEIDETPIEAGVSASADFNHVAPDQAASPTPPEVILETKVQPIEVQGFGMGD